ncbi:MAG: 50S ribosomal protein L21, partial [bacterium]
MIAVLETGGKQYRVSPGSLIRVEKLAAKKGEEVVLDKVLMIKKDEESFIGNPWLAGARVMAEVTKQDRDRKIIVYKFKRRKNYHRKYG